MTFKMILINRISSPSLGFFRITCRWDHNKNLQDLQMMKQMSLNGINIIHNWKKTPHITEMERWCIYSGCEYVTSQNITHHGREISKHYDQVTFFFHFVAPEVLAQQPYGKEVDCWSIGVISYILWVSVEWHFKKYIPAL